MKNLMKCLFNFVILNAGANTGSAGTLGGVRKPR